MANRNPLCDGIFSPEGAGATSEEETQGLGRALAEGLSGGEVISLDGPLGAGKTCFVRGLAVGLGIDPAAVTSPTFTLAHEYVGGRIPLAHFDLYRIRSAAELAGMGWEDYLGGDGVCAVEWGGKFPGILPAGAWRISFRIEGGARRILGRVGKP